jgi:hypothetical protein
METLDYVLAWLVYLVAAVLLSWVHWKFAKKVFWLDLAYVMQGTLMAVIFTPWYVLSDQDILAPAIIIFVMDIVTIETTAGIRALVPMAMVVILVDLIIIIGIAAYRVRKVRHLLDMKKARRVRQNT